MENARLEGQKYTKYNKININSEKGIYSRFPLCKKEAILIHSYQHRKLEADHVKFTESDSAVSACC